MARPRRKFSLYKRKNGSKIVYYAKVKEGGSDNLAEYRLSTGQTSKVAAERWTLAYLENKKKTEQKPKDRISLLPSSLTDSGLWTATMPQEGWQD
ncbi:MAG: hypothetical protein LKE40_15670 [Spirochaetia bacterium]|jgi:nickel-dependent lactate racemase|nr:hypothetical protein [Spirochaetia bacterium]